MWIAFRLILATIGYAIRQLSRGRKRADDGVYRGISYFETVRKAKGSITGFTIGMQRRSPTWLRMHAESSIDRLFKKLGVANEVQTGDPRFDDLVYVTCDHPYVTALLQEAPALRRAIADVFEAGYKRIELNGQTVSIKRSSNEAPAPRDYELLAQLHEASARLEDEMPSRFADPFLWKALLIEGVIWGLAGYAIGAYVEMSFRSEDVHVAHKALAVTGLKVAVAAFVVLLTLIVLWMRGSSRGHRVIVESALVLLLSLPPSAIQVVSDTNRALDDAPSMVVTRTISQCETREHRGRRGRVWYSYHLWLEQEPEATGPSLPQAIDITSELCHAAFGGRTVEIALGPGRWGHPWYRKITIAETAWTSPL